MKAGDTKYKLEVEFERNQRRALSDLLVQCNEKEQAFFKVLYPNGVLKEDLWTAIGLAERTVIKHEKENDARDKH